MATITVSASKKYDVIMENGALQKAGRLFEAAEITADSRICIITDETVNLLYGGPDQPLWQSLEDTGFHVNKYVFPGGESSKTMNTAADILNYLANERFSRNDVLVALGGGITGDITGFSAASYLRGIRYVQIPTTLLAVVDSSVGGKTGVNLDAGKNLAGAFWQPSLVIFDSSVLNTLPHDILLDGIAEAVKAGFIGDMNIIDDLSKGISGDDTASLTSLAARAVKLKKSIVEKDERESGRRQLLNFGHTPAHAIEKCSGYTISHGHAVAIGMLMMSAAADSLGWSAESCTKKLLQILTDFGFPLKCPYSSEDLTDAALRDKKIRGNMITLVIPEKTGRCVLKTVPSDRLNEIFSCGLEFLKGI